MVEKIILYVLLAGWSIILGSQIGRKEWGETFVPIASIICWIVWYSIWRNSQERLRTIIEYEEKIIELKDEIDDLMGTKNNDAR